MENKVKVIIADEHKIFRDGFKILPESLDDLFFVGEAYDGESFSELYDRVKPDPVFLDLKMPKADGLELLKPIRKHSRKTKVIILTANEDSESIAKVIEYGADGFLLKSADYKTIELAVEIVLNGKTYYSEDILDEYLSNRNTAKTKNKDLPKLTKRESEILQLLCKGNSAVDIAEQLQISKRPVEKHKAKIMSKTDVNTTPELIVLAFKHGLAEAE